MTSCLCILRLSKHGFSLCIKGTSVIITSHSKVFSSIFNTQRSWNSPWVWCTIIKVLWSHTVALCEEQSLRWVIFLKKPLTWYPYRPLVIKSCSSLSFGNVIHGSKKGCGEKQHQDNETRGTCLQLNGSLVSFWATLNIEHY